MLNKKIGIILVLVLVIFLGFIFYQNNQAQTELSPEADKEVADAQVDEQIVVEGPSIKIEPDNYDLGTVIYGDVPERIFKVSNLGTEPLEILKLSTSCGCTKASIAEDDKIISPGNSIDMLVTFDPAVHKDNSDLGELIRVIYVKTNDPNNPEIEVEITANVIKRE